MKQSRPPRTDARPFAPATAAGSSNAETGGSGGSGGKARILVATVLHVGLALGALAVVRWALPGSDETTAQASSWPTPSVAASPQDPPNVFPSEETAWEKVAPQESPPVTVASQESPPQEQALAPALVVASHASPPRGPDVLPRIVQWPTHKISATEDADAPPPTPAKRARASAAVRRSTPRQLPPGGVRPQTALPEAAVAWAPAAPPENPETPVDWADPNPDPGDDAILTTGQLDANRIRFQPNASTAQGGTGQTLMAKPSRQVADNAHPARTIAAAPIDAPSYPTGAFFGMPAGHRTVYLIDASGSMLDTLPYAIAHVRQAISTLTPEQSYAVVFFQGSQVVEAPPMGMQAGTRKNITRTLQWLDPSLHHVEATGRTDAFAAMAHALSYEPDTVFLLSDGVTGPRDPAGDRRKIISMAERVSPRPRMHTVQFIDRDPLATRGRMGTLELLASLSNGQHRFVGIDDVRPALVP